MKDLQIAIKTGAICTLPAGMLAVRAIYAGTLDYGFLVWNLFLAWLPLVLACLAVRAAHGRRLTVLPYAVAWLLFLPNAPYLVTDLIHLRPTGDVPVQFDVALLFTAALCGVVLGFVSLRQMELLVVERFGRRAGQLFALSALCLAGFGIYLGRYLRWNSWDIVLNPLALLEDVLLRVAHPIAHWHTWGMSLVFATLLIFVYWLLSEMASSVT